MKTDAGSLAPTDAAARLRALDPERSFIVQAPAGSGKTGLLTQRFLRLLATVDAPEQIVAITFTRKAAAEMRRRILLALSGEVPGPEATGENERLTRELAQAARERAAQMGWALQSHPARLRIQTIDAFCHSLAAQLPLLARAGADLQVDAEARDLYAQAARRTLALIDEEPDSDPAAPDRAEVRSVAEAVKTLLLHRDNQFLQTEALLIDMLARRDQWLRLILEHSSEVLRAKLEQDLAIELMSHLSQLMGRWPEQNLQEVCRLGAEAARRLQDAQAGEWRVPRAVLEDLSIWRRLCGLLQTQAGTWRRTVDKRSGFGPEVKEQKLALLALLEELNAVEGLDRVLALAGELPPPRMNDEQWKVAEALFGLLKIAAAQLELAFRETGQVDFPAVAQAARESLGSAQAPSELALALDYRIRHLLVDEFQDTSFLQIKLLEGLTAGWADGDGRTLFCVGDPMQSIYRFRQAEVGLFLLARERGLGALSLEPLTLTRNFRSDPLLVDWFNSVFKRVLPQQDDLTRGAVRFVPSSASLPSLGSDSAVRIYPSFTTDAAVEAAAVTDQVQTVLQRSPEVTIGILVKQRAHAVRIAAALRQRGLRFQAVELESLASQPVVRDLLALTRALLHSGDRTAWLAVLRSPVCGLKLVDLEILARPQAPENPNILWPQLSDESVRAQLSADARQRIDRLLVTFTGAWSFDSRLPLRTWVERVWISLGGPAALVDARALEDAAAYFERLETLEEEQLLASGTALDEQFAQLFARPDPAAPPNVQIMTIHKAKGLEFDVVVLPGLGRGQSRNDTPLLRWLEVPRPDADPGLLLAPIERKGTQSDPLARYLSVRDQERADHERARLLYVAVTRARRELHLFGHVNVKGKEGAQEMCAPQARSLLALLWPAVQSSFETAFSERGDGAQTSLPVQAARRTLLRRLSTQWSLPPIPPAAGVRAGVASELSSEEPRPEFDWVSEASRHIGTMVHGELERWARLERLPQPQDIETARPRYLRALKVLGIPADRLAAAVERVIQALTGLLADDRGRWIFDPGHREVQSELALSGKFGQDIVNIVIDRTFVDSAGVRWIVDFKTSTHEGADVQAFLDREMERYRGQLERYARLLALSRSQPVKMGLYFPLLRGWREVKSG